MSLLNLAGIIANPVGGLVSDRLGETRVLSGGFLVLAVLIFTFALQPGGVVLYALIFLLGWFLNFSRSPSFTIIPSLFGTSSARSISGINNTFASFGAFALPLLLGYIRDYTQSYQVGWFTLAALSVCSSVLLYFVRTPE
jgi:NNP family nitrate/nitrite transporter-like MFS transporter